MERDERLIGHTSPGEDMSIYIDNASGRFYLWEDRREALRGNVSRDNDPSVGRVEENGRVFAYSSVVDPMEVVEFLREALPGFRSHNKMEELLEKTRELPKYKKVELAEFLESLAEGLARLNGQEYIWPFGLEYNEYDGDIPSWEINGFVGVISLHVPELTTRLAWYLERELREQES